VAKRWPELQLQSSAPQPPTDEVATSPRRKPGPQPKKDWTAHVANLLYRLKRRGMRVPPARRFAQSCENKLGYQPDISAVQKLLRTLRA
jgi:hypothetical protein